MLATEQCATPKGYNEPIKWDYYYFNVKKIADDDLRQGWCPLTFDVHSMVLWFPQAYGIDKMELWGYCGPGKGIVDLFYVNVDI